MKKPYIIIALLVSVKLIIHSIGNLNYGFHRDELLHLSVGEHLRWGYLEFPPMIGFLGFLSSLLGDYSLWTVRMFPTLAGVGVLILCCLMAKELGGKSKAILLAGVSFLAFLPFYRNHTLFQPVAFDQLFWALGYYLLILFLKTEKHKYLLLIGLSFGLGMLTKYTMLMWGLGVGISMLVYSQGSILKNRWLYVSIAVSLLVMLPHIIWQVSHDFPALDFILRHRENQLDETSIWEFGLEQLNFPFTLIISIFGIYGLFSSPLLKKYKAISIAVMVTFFSMWALKSKGYYVFAIYPVVFAAGSVYIEYLLRNRAKLFYIIPIVLMITTIPFMPQAIPILPIEKYVDWYDIQEENGRFQLSGDYADMHGWEEQVFLVDSIFSSLSDADKKNCVLWAKNYGEAGALKIIGDKYGLPDPICRHGTFWTWGYKNKDAAVWISLGNEAPSVNHVFEDVRLVKIITHKYAIGEENGIPLYICRKPKIDIDQWWKDHEGHVFD